MSTIITLKFCNLESRKNIFNCRYGELSFIFITYKYIIHKFSIQFYIKKKMLMMIVFGDALGAGIRKRKITLLKKPAKIRKLRGK